MLAAPLMAGNDLRAMSPATREILTQPEVLDVSQDALGRQGYRVAQSGQQEVWAKPLAGGAWAVALFNRGDGPGARRLGAQRPRPHHGALHGRSPAARHGAAAGAVME